MHTFAVMCMRRSEGPLCSQFSPSAFIWGPGIETGLPGLHCKLLCNPDPSCKLSRSASGYNPISLFWPCCLFRSDYADGFENLLDFSLEYELATFFIPHRVIISYCCWQNGPFVLPQRKRRDKVPLVREWQCFIFINHE